MIKLRVLRQGRGLTLADLCRARGLNVPELSQVERRRLAASRRLKDVAAKFYGVKSGELFDNADFAREA